MARRVVKKAAKKAPAKKKAIKKKATAKKAKPKSKKRFNPKPKIEAPMLNPRGLVTQKYLREFFLARKRRYYYREKGQVMRQRFIDRVEEEGVIRCQSGKFELQMEEVEKSTVNWKDEYIKVKGEKAADRLIAKAGKRVEQHVTVDIAQEGE